MGIRSVRTAGIAAILACAWAGSGQAAGIINLPPSPATGPAGPNATMTGDYLVIIDGGTYTDIVDPFAGGTFNIDPSTNMIDSADIFLGSPLSLEFNNILAQNTVAGNKYEATIEDTTDTYELNLVLDDWTGIEAGAQGANIDSSSDVTELPPNTSTIVANDITGSLDVPAPAALPVFMTALAGLGWFRRRKQA
jgi:hypothetical protein